MFHAHQQVDRLVLHIDIGIAQQLADPLHIQLTIHNGERVQSGLTNGFALVAELRFQRADDVGPVELGQDVNQVNADCQILAAHPRNQIGHHVLCRDVTDDLEKCGLFAGLDLVNAAQQLAQIQALLLCPENVDKRRGRYVGIAEQIEKLIRIVAVRR